MSVVTSFLISFYSTEIYILVFVYLNSMFSDVKLHLNIVYYAVEYYNFEISAGQNIQNFMKIHKGHKNTAKLFHFYRTFSALVKLGA